MSVPEWHTEFEEEWKKHYSAHEEMLKGTEDAWNRLKADLHIGQIIFGIVVRHETFGVFLDIGSQLCVLVTASNHL